MEKIIQYFNNLIERSLKWFQGLSSIKKLFVCIFGVLLLAISVGLLSNGRKNYEIIDYEKVTKYKISKSEFKKNVKNIVNDFYSEYGIKDIKELKTNSIVDKIYDYQPRNGMYIVKLNINKKSYYVGIKFSTVNNTYNIFYFE